MRSGVAARSGAGSRASATGRGGVGGRSGSTDAPVNSREFRNLLRRVDLRVLIPAITLALIGLVSIASDKPGVLMAQARWTVVGMAVVACVLLLPYRRVFDLAYPLYALSIILLVLVLIPGVGTTVNGARRWIRIGSFSLQPSELAKVAHVLVLARYIRFRKDHRTLKGLLIPFVLTLLPMALIVKEPDLGTALMMVPVLFALLWVAGAQSRHLGTVVVLGLASIPILYLSLPDNHYQKRRVQGFIHAVNPVEASVSSTPIDDYHLRESLAAVAGGGVAGQGFREGAQNRMDRVPESWTDFIFAVHAEEWGFAGVALLLLAEFGLLFGLASVARDVREPAGRLVAVGALVLFGVQATVNIAMTIGLAPITGLPLPFVSYGGSAMITSWLLIALPLNARAREPFMVASGDFD